MIQLPQHSAPSRIIWIGALTPTDKINLLNVVLAAFNALVAVCSALIALRAARIAANAIAAQAQIAHSERRYQAFRALVADPAHEMLPRFEDAAVAAMANGAERVTTLIARNAGHQSVKEAAIRLKEEVLTLLKPVYYRLVGSARSWGDNGLQIDLEDTLLALEDEIVDACRRLPVTDDPSTVLPQVIRAGVERITAVIVHYDVDPPAPPKLSLPTRIGAWLKPNS